MTDHPIVIPRDPVTGRSASVAPYDGCWRIMLFKAGLYYAAAHLLCRGDQEKRIYLDAALDMAAGWVQGRR